VSRLFLDPSVCGKLFYHADRADETGGLLFGYNKDDDDNADDLQILLVSHCGPDSIEMRDSFTPDVSYMLGFAECFAQVFNMGAFGHLRTLRRLPIGDWHSHGSSLNLFPSEADLKALQQAASIEPEHIMLIVGINAQAVPLACAYRWQEGRLNQLEVVLAA
jgi:hypothetical protein